MATIEELLVKISADVEGLSKGLNKASAETQKQTKKMSDFTKAFSSKAGGHMSMFEQSVGSMAGFIGGSLVVGAFNLFGKAISASFDILKAGIAESSQAQEASARLAAALRSAGISANATKAEFNSFSDSMTKLYVVEGEVVDNTVATLASLTDLDKDGLKKATESALILSNALGVDLESATRMVAKASEGNTDSLKKYGIVVSDTGSKSGNYANALDQINKLSDVAKSKTNTFSGSMKGLSIAYNDILQSIGDLITSNPILIDLMKSLGNLFSSFKDNITNNKEEMSKLLSEGIIGIVNGFDVMLNILDKVSTALKLLTLPFRTMVNTWMAGFEAMQSVIDGEGISTAFDKLKQHMNDTGDNIKSAFSGDTVFDSLRQGFKGISESANKTYEAVKTGAISAVAPQEQLNKRVEEMKFHFKDAQEAQIEFAQGLIDQSQEMQTQVAFQTEILQKNRDDELISDEEFYAQKLEVLNTYYTERQAQLDKFKESGAMGEREHAAATIELSKNKMLEENKIDEERSDAAADELKEREEAISGSLDAIGTLSTSKNKQLAQIGKAAQIAQAIRSTYVGVNKTMEKVPWPLNLPLAAGMLAAGMANVAKIRSTKAKRGIDSVPGIGQFDNFPAVLAPGERVVPSETNKDLSSFLEAARTGALGGVQQVTRIELSFKDEFMDLVEAKLVERLKNKTTLRIV